VFLVDAETGLLRGLRRVAMSAGMASELNAAVREEDAKPFHGDDAYRREVMRAASRYPSPAAMALHAFTSSDPAAR
jgi:hypothetical protein